MHLLLTGGTGFIGKNFIRFIRQHHSSEVERITVITQSKSAEDGIIHYVPCSDYNAPDFSLVDFNSIDIVIHSGAYIPKQSSINNDEDHCLGNILFTHSLVNALSQRQKKIIYTSTIDVYGSSETPIHERTSVNPSTLYAASKFYCEQQVKAAGSFKKIPYTILRLGHIYGPGEEEYKKIIPLTIQNILRKQPVRLFTSGEEQRSFLYIEDYCRMMWNSVSPDTDGMTINVVSGNSYPILQIILKIFELLQIASDIVYDLNPEIKTRNILFDHSLCTRYLGEERIDLDEGLRREIDYFRELNITTNE